MTDGTTKRYNDGEVLSGVQRRRRWTPEEKVRIVEETYLPGMSVSFVARQHGISGSQVFTWRRLMSQRALTAAAAGEEVVPASDYRALEAQVRELQRLLGKKAMENELLREAVSRAAGPKNCCCARPRCPGMVCDRGRRRVRHHPPASVRDAQQAASATTRTATTSRRRAGRRHPPARRRSADLRLSSRACPAAPPGGKERARKPQCQTRLPRHEGARAAAPAGWRTS
jgi:transposase